MASVFDISWLSYVYSQSVVPLLRRMPDAGLQRPRDDYYVSSLFMFRTWCVDLHPCHMTLWLIVVTMDLKGGVVLGMWTLPF